MKRIVSLVLLLLLLAAVPAAALESRDIQNYNTTPMALAWRTGDTIYVAIVNEYTSRELHRIEIYDIQRRSALAKREVIVPGKSILIEAFEARDLKSTRFPIEEVTIYTGYYGRTIKIQDGDLFAVNDYLVPANTSIRVDVDIAGIRGAAASGRLVVDDKFYLVNQRIDGRITVNYEPGIDYVHSNIIEYRPPTLTLTMRTPSVRNVDLLSFNIRHRPSGDWRDELIVGPVIIVYGREYRVLDNTGDRSSSSGSSGDWVVRW